MRLLEDSRARRALEAALQHLDIADDDRQQIVEVVRQAARELADRLHLLRLRSSARRARAVRSWIMPTKMGRPLLCLADREIHGKVVPSLRWPRPRGRCR